MQSYTFHLSAKKSPKQEWESWNPRFKKFDVTLSNYNGEMWPDSVQKNLVDYVGGGGAFVVVHAADNAFSGWKEYNEMIGLGGWGGRSEKSGPYLYFDEKGKLIRDRGRVVEEAMDPSLNF